jgi:hypothetical protein
MGTNPQIVTGKKHGLPEILDFSPAAHNQLFTVASAYPQTVPGGGHSGLGPAAACGMVTHMASSTAARSSNVFFTANSLVEVGISP